MRRIALVVALLAVAGILLLSLEASGRQRMYDPKTGRFMQRDSIGYPDGMNQYEFVRSNPVTGRDPTGLFDLSYHEQLTRESLKESGFSDDVILAVVVYNFEADIMYNYRKYTKALSVIKDAGDALKAELTGAAEGLRRMGMPADATAAEALRFYYSQLHMDDLSEEAGVLAHWEHSIGEIVDPHKRLSVSRKLERWGNYLHKLQDGFAHSNWAELTSNEKADTDLRSAKSLYDVYGKFWGRWNMGLLPRLYTGVYSQKDPVKSQKTHAELNKDDATRPYFGIAYASALKTTKEVGDELVQKLKKGDPDLYKQLTRPLPAEERKSLQSKYELYKLLAQKVGHWSNGQAPDIPATQDNIEPAAR